MSKLPGVFNQFVDLENVPIENINRWLKTKVDQISLENYIANRIFYPQTIPSSPTEMEFDLAILREALRISSQTFYEINENKITIPLEYTFRFYPLEKLITAFIDALSLKGVTKIFIRNETKEYIIGSIASYQPSTENLITLSLNNQVFELKVGTLTLFPTKEPTSNLSINNNEEELEVYGGEFGLLVDLRNPLA